MVFKTRERQNWIRQRSHTVVFDRDPAFDRFRRDASGTVMRILHLWVAESRRDPQAIRAYLGSIRYCEGWCSQAELTRVYRQAEREAARRGESRSRIRKRLSRLLRAHFGDARRPQ